MSIRTWRELFPQGRSIFYEGDDAEEFRQQIKAEFGFDPGDSDGWNRADGWRFHCPPQHLDAIYGVSRFPVGS